MSQIGSAATGSSATLDGVVRAFLVQGVRDPVMRERVVLGLEAATTMLAGLLRERSDVDHPDPELAADVIVRTIVGALQQTILLDRSFPEERYIAELGRAARCYLTAPPQCDGIPTGPS
jgi:Tetracyclin repressor-like, C-terminal domain